MEYRFGEQRSACNLPIVINNSFCYWLILQIGSGCWYGFNDDIVLILTFIAIIRNNSEAANLHKHERKAFSNNFR